MKAKIIKPESDAGKVGVMGERFKWPGQSFWVVPITTDDGKTLLASHWKTIPEVVPLDLNKTFVASLLADKLYPNDLYENYESFRSKRMANPDGCFAALDNGELVGYAISFPWDIEEVVPINTIITPHPNPNGLYIHDVLVDPYYRGLGVGKNLVNAVLNASKYKNISLVSVLGSEKFWSKFGFVENGTISYAGAETGVKMRRLT